MRRWVAALLVLSLTAACGRPLTEGERAFAQTVQGNEIDLDRVRLHDGAPTRAVTFKFKARPRTTCRERILPPPQGDTITSKPAAVALFNTVLFDRDWYLDDYLPAYPGQIGLIEAMLLAHELTHVWQWQNRAKTGYSPLRAAFEHQYTDDPYLFELTTGRKFGDFGFEQQGNIVEEFVCCRALDPTAPRTKRLHAMISEAMPVAPLPHSRPDDVRMPWSGVKVEGICS
ncbi:hypothetical protein R5H30_16265 [Sulfitobacter sp. D35]|uniref:hypothetical protein n=1 Tax=Sulfitobacter sp. D35 TaxID=3083252 RepID=UPI00296F5119|nr:hypothetical protein [Sulfitobacter sp. D35]MDW4499549.1 hypothetical protein [Sulfitobacter sp. D35]